MPKKEMTRPINRLYTRKSGIPGAGKGLYSRNLISKGSFIIDYVGRITTWKEIKESDIFNPYVYYVTRNYVIDAFHNLKDLARYANDAKGITKVPGLTNNAEYVQKGKKVFMQAKKTILPDTEIFVAYGKEYWDAVLWNLENQLK